MIEYVTYLAETSNDLFKEASKMEKIKNPSEKDILKLAVIGAKLELSRDYIGKFTQLVTGKKKK